ncbi:hypothetical protein ABZW30_29915 [Kitasatospora sp. NPDC004669]|uniref:hypothetical protein n=1 Tax=Kitasatospora sp. NPDC004669 TaxID=3154555 RepID=UPI0033B83042
MSDITFWSWFTAAAGCLVAASTLAFYMSGATDTPTGRHRAGSALPIRPDVSGLRVPAYHRREPTPVTFAPEPTPEPVNLPEPVRTLPLGPTRQEVDAAAIEREQRAHHAPETVEPSPTPKPIPTPEELPRPATVAVVPLWVRRWETETTEAQRQAARREALAVIGSDAMPDPGYTYEGAHSLGAVA